MKSSLSGVELQKKNTNVNYMSQRVNHLQNIIGNQSMILNSPVQRMGGRKDPQELPKEHPMLKIAKGRQSGHGLTDLFSPQPARQVDDLSYGAYNELTPQYKGTGVECHHLLTSSGLKDRFDDAIEVAPAVALTHEQHVETNSFGNGNMKYVNANNWKTPDAWHREVDFQCNDVAKYVTQDVSGLRKYTHDFVDTELFPSGNVKK